MATPPRMMQSVSCLFVLSVLQSCVFTEWKYGTWVTPDPPVVEVALPQRVPAPIYGKVWVTDNTPRYTIRHKGDLYIDPNITRAFSTAIDRLLDDRSPLSVARLFNKADPHLPTINITLNAESEYDPWESIGLLTLGLVVPLQLQLNYEMKVELLFPGDTKAVREYDFEQQACVFELSSGVTKYIRHSDALEACVKGLTGQFVNNLILDYEHNSQFRRTKEDLDEREQFFDESAPPQLARRVTHALLVGIDEYANWNTLNSPGKDVTDLSDALRSEYAVSVKAVRNPKGPIRAIVEEWYKDIRNQARALDPKDDYYGQLFIYIACHGCYDERRGTSYLASAESRNVGEAQFISTLEPIEDVIRPIEYSEEFDVLVFVNACYSGASHRTVEPSEEDIVQKITKQRFAMYVSSSRTTAADGAPGDNTEFAKGILHGLVSQGGSDRVLFFEDLARHYMGVVAEPPARLYGHENGTFYLQHVFNEKSP